MISVDETIQALHDGFMFTDCVVGMARRDDAPVVRYPDGYSERAAFSVDGGRWHIDFWPITALSGDMWNVVIDTPIGATRAVVSAVDECIQLAIDTFTTVVSGSIQRRVGGR